MSTTHRCKVTKSRNTGPSTDKADFILGAENRGIADYSDIDHNRDHRKSMRGEGRIIRVTTVSPDDFLRQNGTPREIDQISIDTKGNEHDSLKSFRFQDWKIHMFSMRHNITDQRKISVACRKLMVTGGPRARSASGTNRPQNWPDPEQAPTAPLTNPFNLLETTQSLRATDRSIGDFLIS